MRSRNSLALVVVVVFVALVTLAERSHASLGCTDLRDTITTSSLPASERVASCDETADCAPVGGVECTGGLCLCPQGPLEPFCSCLAPTAPAPVVSHSALIGLALLLSLIGLVQLWRRGNAVRGGTNRPAA